MDRHITKNFDCSTAHITGEDNNRLFSYHNYLVIYPYEEGVFIYVPSTDFEEFLNNLKEIYSEHFKNLLRLAHDNDCKYLQLDSDGIEYEDLPTFDW